MRTGWENRPIYPRNQGSHFYLVTYVMVNVGNRGYLNAGWAGAQSGLISLTYVVQLPYPAFVGYLGNIEYLGASDSFGCKSYRD